MKHPRKLLFIGVDGAVGATILQHIGAGALPHLQRLLERGAWFENCLPAFPTITPTCWATLATGATPATHGITCSDVHIPGMPFDQQHNGYRSEMCLAERFWEAAARAGKRSVVMDYPTSGPARSGLVTQINGTTCTTLDYFNSSAKHGFFGVGPRLFSTRDKAEPVVWLDSLTPPSGQWQGPRAPDIAAVGAGSGKLRARLHVNPDDSFWDVAPFDWHVELNGHTVALRETPQSEPVGVVARGQWSPVWERTLGTSRGPFTFRYRIKVIEADAARRSLALFFSPLADFEPVVTPPEFVAAMRKIPGLATYSKHADFWGAGIIDDATYLEIEKMNLDAEADVIARAWAQGVTDVSVAYTVMIDTINHKYGAMIEGLTGDAASRAGAADMELQAYKLVDEFVGRLVEQAGPGALVVLAGDHGRVGMESIFHPAAALKKAGLMVTRPRANGVGEEIVWEQTRAVPFGSVHIFVNLKGREPSGIVEPRDYEATVDAIIAALYDYTDEKTGKKGAALALGNADARLLGLGGERTGDVVWGVTGRIGGYYGGVHACQIPTASTPTGDIRALLLMAGPGIRAGVRMPEHVHQWDVAPTICHHMGWPLPAQAEGRIIQQVFAY